MESVKNQLYVVSSKDNGRSGGGVSPRYDIRTSRLLVNNQPINPQIPESVSNPACILPNCSLLFSLAAWSEGRFAPILLMKSVGSEATASRGWSYVARVSALRPRGQYT